MCFIPCLATASPPTLTPYANRVEPIILYALRHLKPSDLDNKFTLPHRAHIGLITGCGCYLRNVRDWPWPTFEAMAEQPDYNAMLPLTQPNHDALADYLLKHFRQDGFVEFYGFWDATSEPPKARLELGVEDIRHPHFHFRSDVVYRILLDAVNPPASSFPDTASTAVPQG